MCDVFVVFCSLFVCFVERRCCLLLCVVVRGLSWFVVVVRCWCCGLTVLSRFCHCWLYVVCCLSSVGCR